MKTVYLFFICLAVSGTNTIGSTRNEAMIEEHILVQDTNRTFLHNNKDTNRTFLHNNNATKTASNNY